MTSKKLLFLQLKLFLNLNIIQTNSSYLIFSMDKGVVQRGNFLCLIFILLTSFTIAEAVVGGENAKSGEFPYAVKLVDKYTGDIFCGGSILSPDVVLTAAHCLYVFYGVIKFQPDLIWVAAGGVKLGENGKAFGKEMEEGEQLRTVSHYFAHPEYHGDNNDIALLFLKKPFNYTKNIAPIQLPSSPNQNFSGGIFSGWGNVVNDTPSLHLKKLSLALDERDSCDEGFTQDKVADSEMCSKLEKGVATCEGDSGGSLVCHEEQSSSMDLSVNETKWSPVICGISARERRQQSWGRRSSCGETRSVATFTDVKKYLDWIQDTMESKRLPNSVEKVKHPQLISNCSLFEFDFVCGIHGYTCLSREDFCDGVNNCEDGFDELAEVCQIIENEWSLDSGNNSLATTAGNESEPNTWGWLTVFLWFLGFAILGSGLIVGVIVFKKEIVKPVDSFV